MISQEQQSLQRFVNQVRMYLRDFPELNRLVDGYESSDRMLAWAVIDALDDFNNTPPAYRRVHRIGLPLP